MKRSLASLLIALSAGCGGGLEDAQVAAAVSAAFAQANPAGRTGRELQGKAVWLTAEGFDKSCIEQKQLAFNDDPGSRPSSAMGMPRLSPSYAAQVGITEATATGFCVDLGADPHLEVEEVVWNVDRYRVATKLSMGTPTPWFACLDSGTRNPMVIVTVSDAGMPVVESPMDLGQGACPTPIAAMAERVGRRAPKATPPAGPTRAQVIALAGRLDEALWQGDWDAALGETACWNLYEETPFGACARADIISLGPMPRAEEARPEHGTPWLENVVADITDIGRIRADREDAGLFHVAMTHKRTGRDHSFSVQWVGEGWKVVALVGQKGEGLTTARYVTNLNRKDRRDTFRRVLAGEKLTQFGDIHEPPEDAAAMSVPNSMVTTF